MSNLSNLAARDAEDVLHGVSNLGELSQHPPIMVQRGQGIRLSDDQGNEFIDGMSGLWCASLGYSNEEIARAAYEQLLQLPYAHLFMGKGTEPAALLADKLKNLVPGDFSKVFFGLSGSDANDTQIKLVRYYFRAIGKPEKRKIITRERGYHGSTLASASATGLTPFHTGFGIPSEGFLKTDCPHYYRYHEAGESEDDFVNRITGNLEALILKEDPETIGAFMAEPIMAAGGVIVAPDGYFDKVQEILKKYEILFIDDEVVTGFGRIGKPFGAQAFDLQPDTITLAKSLTAAFLPLSAVMVPAFMYEAMAEISKDWGIFGHGFTYSGHPASCAVGLKVLEIYEREKTFEHAERIGEIMQSELASMRDHPLVGETRGMGMIGAAELVADKKSGKPFSPELGVGKYCLGRLTENGLFCRAIGESIALCPPLVSTDEDIGEIFRRYRKSIDETLDWATREGVLD